MVFSSLLFLFRFLPMVLLLYFAAPRMLRNLVLLLVSLLVLFPNGYSWSCFWSAWCFMPGASLYM